MNNWIELNLPYRVRLDEHFDEPLPDLSQEIKKIFGKSRDEYKNELNSQLFDYFYDKSGEIGDLLDEDSREEVENKLLELNDEKINKVLEYRKFNRKVNEWENNQPSIMAWELRREAFNKNIKEKEAKLSFCGAGLNKSGTLIEIELDGRLQQILIGDVNTLAGVCDDCRMFDDSTIVKRYKVVYNNENT